MDQMAEMNTSGKLTGLLASAGIRGRQVAEAFQLTTESIVNVLKEELKNGNFRDVLAILKGRPLAAGSRLLKAEITGRVVKGLMLRFGIRKLVALGIAAIIIPFVIGKLSQKLVQGHYVQDFLHSLNLKNKFQEIFTARNAMQPSPELQPIAEAETFESEFLTD